MNRTALGSNPENRIPPPHYRALIERLEARDVRWWFDTVTQLLVVGIFDVWVICGGYEVVWQCMAYTSTSGGPRMSKLFTTRFESLDDAVEFLCRHVSNRRPRDYRDEWLYRIETERDSDTDSDNDSDNDSDSDNNSKE